MAEFVEFTLKVVKEKYEGDDGLRAIAVEALNYPALVQDMVQAQVQATDESGKPIEDFEGFPKMIPVINKDGTPHMIEAKNEDGSPKMITNPISEDQFVKISIKECVKKFFKDLTNLRNSRRATTAGTNDFDLT